MSAEETRALLQALRQVDHTYVGIRPADATPAEAPCIILGGRNVNDLSYALVTAGQEWPACTAWVLIGSDEKLKLSNPEWPPTMHALRMPATLATFATTT